MKKTSFAALAIVAVAATTGCNSVMKNLNIENPEYSIRDVRPRVSIALPLSASTIDFDMNVEVDNPNRVALNLDRIDFDLLVDGQHVVSGVSRDRIRIPANGVGDVRLRARVGYNELRSLWREVTQAVQGDRARYEVKGRVYYDTPLGRLDFPLTIYRSRI